MEKRSFLNNIRLIFSTSEKILNNFRSKIFPIKNTLSEQAPEPQPKLALEPAPEPAPEPASEPAPELATEPIPETTPEEKKATKAKTERKTSPLKLRKEFSNNIKNEEKT